jgi:NodT family efflux transporter outer membrane factor (OMF) lipoprotein
MGWPCLIAAVMWLALCGCATPPTAPVSATAVEVPLAHWWTRFDDPTLTALIDQALLANTTVASAQAALRQARALRDGVAAGGWPTLNSSASVQRTARGSNVNGTGTAASSFQAGLDAHWELDIFGAHRNALDASDAVARASAASWGATQVSVAAEVALNYIALRTAQMRLNIARANQQSQSETLQITLWRHQAGLVGSIDTEQAQSAAEQTSAMVPSLQAVMTQTRHAVAVLTGQVPTTDLPALVASAPAPQIRAGLVLTLPAETLRQRPDVYVAEQQVQAARSRVAQAEAMVWPSFQLSGTLGSNAPTLAALATRSSVSAALLAGVSWTLFDAGATSAQVRAQQAALDLAHISYRATVLTALTEVEDALVALRADLERQAHLQRAAAAADSANLLAQLRYRSGLIGFQTVLETQRTRLGTQDALASAQGSLSTDHVRLYKALGGGWTNISTAD